MLEVELSGLSFLLLERCNAGPEFRRVSCRYQREEETEGIRWWIEFRFRNSFKIVLPLKKLHPGSESKTGPNISWLILIEVSQINNYYPTPSLIHFSLLFSSKWRKGFVIIVKLVPRVPLVERHYGRGSAMRSEATNREWSSSLSRFLQVSTKSILVHSQTPFHPSTSSPSSFWVRTLESSNFGSVKMKEILWHAEFLLFNSLSSLPLP